MNISAPSVTSQSCFSPLVSVQIVLLRIALSKLFLRVYNLNVEYWAGIEVGCDSSFFCFHYLLLSLSHCIFKGGHRDHSGEGKKGRHKY